MSDQEQSQIFELAMAKNNLIIDIKHYSERLRENISNKLLKCGTDKLLALQDLIIR